MTKEQAARLLGIEVVRIWYRWFRQRAKAAGMTEEEYAKWLLKADRKNKLPWEE